MSDFIEFGVGIYRDDLDQTFDTIDEARDSCQSSYFQGLDCYLYGIDKWGGRTYIERRLATAREIYVTDKDGHIHSEAL